jgi:hypothetical protein
MLGGLRQSVWHDRCSTPSDSSETAAVGASRTINIGEACIMGSDCFGIASNADFSQFFQASVHLLREGCCLRAPASSAR